MQYLPQWERVAVVTDVGWFRHTVNALRFLMPGEVRVFSTDDAYEGCAWISSPPIPEPTKRIDVQRTSRDMQAVNSD
jgi:hypothetical protein